MLVPCRCDRGLREFFHVMQESVSRDPDIKHVNTSIMVIITEKKKSACITYTNAIQVLLAYDH